jgi:large subunit ribosomal protein L21
MFAIVEDGSRQLRVQEGETLRIDYRDGANAGDTVTLGRVLLANGGGPSVIGAPEISGASVTAEVVEPETKGPKLEVQKFRRRKNVRRHTGHRQKYTTVRISSIKVPGLKIVEKSADSDKE